MPECRPSKGRWLSSWPRSLLRPWRRCRRDCWAPLCRSLGRRGRWNRRVARARTPIADPARPDFVIVLLFVVILDRQSERPRGQAADARQHAVIGDLDVVARADQADLGVEQLLLGVQNVKGRARA